MDNTSAPNRTPSAQATGRSRWGIRWHWQAMLAVLLAIFVVDGHIVADTYAASGIAARAADVARRVGTPGPWPSASPSASPSPTDVSIVAEAVRPDFRVTFSRVNDTEPGMPVSYTIQIRNDGQEGGAATMTTVVPLAFSNVRASAPGFACARRFTPNGEQAGTLVTCTRNDLEAGASTELIIEANASDMTGIYALTATVDPRDDVLESDEANNAASATLRIRA